MTYIEYQNLAQRTLKDRGLELNLCHMVIGIHSEWNEFLKAPDKINAGEELGDMMWYIANYCTQRGLSLEQIATAEFPFFKESISYYSSQLDDIIKRMIFYKSPVDEAVLDKERIVLQHLIRHITTEFAHRNLWIGDFLRKNIAKLAKRYPEKFSEELALNRNIFEERFALENE